MYINNKTQSISIPYEYVHKSVLCIFLEKKNTNNSNLFLQYKINNNNKKHTLTMTYYHKK